MTDSIDVKSATTKATPSTGPLDAKNGGGTVVQVAGAVQGADQPSPSSNWRRIVGFFWDTVEGDPEYRKYVRRLDLFFL